MKRARCWNRAPALQLRLTAQWVGRLVRLRRQVVTRGRDVFEAGTVLRVDGVSRGALHLLEAHTLRYIRKVSPAAVAVVGLPLLAPAPTYHGPDCMGMTPAQAATLRQPW